MTNIFPGDSVIYTIIFNLSIQIDQFKWAQLNFPISPPCFLCPISHCFYEWGPRSLLHFLKKNVFLPFYRPNLRIVLFLFLKLFPQDFRLSGSVLSLPPVQSTTLEAASEIHVVSWMLKTILQVIFGILYNWWMATGRLAVNYLSNLGEKQKQYWEAENIKTKQNRKPHKKIKTILRSCISKIFVSYF